jgi:hypothetical protein
MKVKRPGIFPESLLPQFGKIFYFTLPVKSISALKVEYFGFSVVNTRIEFIVYHISPFFDGEVGQSYMDFPGKNKHQLSLRGR